MEFAFYKETGTLHDCQEFINEDSVDPSTGRFYTLKDIDGLRLVDLYDILADKTLKDLVYLIKNYQEELMQSIYVYQDKLAKKR